MSVIFRTQKMENKYTLFHQANDTDANPISLQNFELFEMFRNAGSGRIDNITQNPRLSTMSLGCSVLGMFSVCGSQRYYPVLNARDEDILERFSLTSVVEILSLYTPKSKSWLPIKKEQLTTISLRYQHLQD